LDSLRPGISDIKVIGSTDSSAEFRRNQDRRIFLFEQERPVRGLPVNWITTT
jgi:hypothetical protein